jgi:CHAT domain-containing protein
LTVLLAVAALHAADPAELTPEQRTALAKKAAELDKKEYTLYQQGRYAEAVQLRKESHIIREQLYPADKYPQGHPDLARSLNNLGFLLSAQGEYAKAEPFLRDALQMRQQLYPADKYPQGHPDLARSLNNLGFLLSAQGEYAKAEPFLRDALAMQQAHFLRFADLVAETEALNFAATQTLTLDAFLSTTRRLPAPPNVYPFVWQARGALAKIQQRRQLDLLASRDPESEKLGRELLETRQRLARLLLSAPRDPAAHAQPVQQQTNAKEELERRLVRQLRLTLPAAADQTHPDQLRDRLPAGTAFIDLLRYIDFSQDPKVPGKKGEKRTPRYVAFIVRPGQAVAQVELGEAAPIEQAWTAWHGALTGGRPDRAAAAALARLVWQPLRAQLPAKVHTVWLAPDGALTRIPWAALPGAKADTILLEEHTVAVVPHGAFLLQQLTAGGPGRVSAPSGPSLLAVGGVAYDQAPSAVQPPKDEVVRRAPAVGDKRLVWKALPGTDRERQQIVALARKALAREPLERSAATASVAQLLVDLPRVRYAHLATHGFFADPSFRSALQVDEKQFVHFGRERRVAGARSPLVLAGLVLAGANKPGTPDRGILTAEAIIGLRLTDLELAVLSACETGLGEVAGGEGVFGLQRAFHVAGTRNVVASLWKVDDKATAALMGLFYRNLWIEKQEPLEALRQAQLHLYRNPGQIAALAKLRGVDFTETELPKVTAEPAKGQRAATQLWAAFVLSGLGR